MQLELPTELLRWPLDIGRSFAIGRWIGSEISVAARHPLFPHAARCTSTT
jgi:hypothetical protein